MDLPSDLSDEDRAFCMGLLERIFLKSENDLDGFLEAQLPLISRLIRLFKNPEAQSHILTAFSDPVRLQLLKLLPAAYRVSISTACTDQGVWTHLFPLLSNSKQNTILKKFYRQNPDLYAFLKTLNPPTTLHPSGLQVDLKPLTSKTLSPKEAQRFLNFVISPDFSAKDILKEAKALTKTLDPEVIHQLLLELIRQFNMQGIPLSSPANCLSYIKFFELVFYFDDIIPDLQLHLKRPYDRVIIGLSQLSGHEWVLKVLGQFHASAIHGMLTLLSRHSQLSSLEKRSQYSKLFSVLKSYHLESTSKALRSFFGG
jgi:hypothetical protein